MGDLINLERAMKITSRLDGHIVQGHVDQLGFCTGIDFREGSWFFDFDYDQHQQNRYIYIQNINVKQNMMTTGFILSHIYSTTPR